MTRRAKPTAAQRKAMIADRGNGVCASVCFPSAPPSLNNAYATGKNGRRFKSPKLAAWLDEAAVCISRQRPPHVAGRYALDIAIPRSVGGDIDNRVKAISDALVNACVVEDDSLMDELHIRRRETVDDKVFVFVKRAAA